MSNSSEAGSGQQISPLSADWWAVIAALALALLVRLGWIQRVPW